MISLLIKKSNKQPIITLLLVKKKELLISHKTIHSYHKQIPMRNTHTQRYIDQCDLFIMCNQIKQKNQPFFLFLTKVHYHETDFDSS